MTVLPLAFNLVDYASSVAVIGKIPATAIPEKYQDLISFWQEEFKFNEILSGEGRFIVSSASLAQKYTHSSQLDDFFQEIAPMPESEKIKTFFIIANPLEWNSDFLSEALATSRPKHSSLILFLKEFSGLPDGLQMAIFATCFLMIIGNLSESDKAFFLTNRFFAKGTEAILNFKENEYAICYRDYHPRPELVFCANAHREWSKQI